MLIAIRVSYTVVVFQEICIDMVEGEKLGISIRGGTKNQIGNPFDKTDEGIFVSRVSYYLLLLQSLWSYSLRSRVGSVA